MPTNTENFNNPDRHYNAALDSVNLINNLVAKTELTQDEKDSIDRNVQHLEIMIAKDFWTEAHNPQPLIDAVAAGKAKIAVPVE